MSSESKLEYKAYAFSGAVMKESQFARFLVIVSNRVKDLEGDIENSRRDSNFQKVSKVRLVENCRYYNLLLDRIGLNWVQ